MGCPLEPLWTTGHGLMLPDMIFLPSNVEPDRGTAVAHPMAPNASDPLNSIAPRAIGKCEVDHARTKYT